jgi:DNA-directed RNA polymerase specialized sigma24 family protein
VGQTRQTESWRKQDLQPWEFKLIQGVAARVNTPDREDLEADLAQKVFLFKRHSRARVRDWKRYLARFLHNKALNWVRNRRTHDKRIISLDSSRPTQSDNTFTLADILKSPETDHELRQEFARVWRQLEPDFQAAWQLLEEERGNQAQVARRLGKHRNTVRSWIHQIQDVLIAHGLKPAARTSQTRATPIKALQHSSRRSRAREKSVVIRARTLLVLMKLRLSGTQWRILLWVLLQTARRKQRTAPFRWRDIAQQLALDPTGVARAARKLVHTGLLFVHQGRLGLRRNL